MQIIKATKGRAYPNKKQQAQIDKTLNVCRFVYNEMLARNIKAYKRRGKHLSYMDMQNLLPKMKAYLPWLKEVDAKSIRFACRQLDTAYKKFFNHEAKFPNFHSKRGRQSYATEQPTVIKTTHNKVCLPKLGWLKVRGIRQLPNNAKICYVTVSKETDGKYYVSITYKYEEIIVPKPINKVIGLDYKSNGLYMSSEGYVPKESKWFRENQARLRKAQRKLSRRQGSHMDEHKSSSWTKQYRKVLKIQKYIANQRRDWLHKESRRLADTYDLIGVEDLNMKSLSNKGFGNGKAVMDNGYGMFTQMLDYKLKYQGKQLVRIDKFYPSSQICSYCNYQNKEVKNLTIRHWTCPNCKTTHDRDLNASINIRNEAIRILAKKLA